MSFYLKYRPQTFFHLVGQNHINQTLLNALKTERVSHAYLFTGPRGTGKTSTARLMAKAINCLNPKENEPCNECEICTDITDGRLIDLIEIDAASNRGIDEIRDLREKINFAPSRAKSKIYIIDEVHMLTKEAFNALLKTLEEPPNHVYFILATTEVHKIPETILSRCQRFDFKRIDDKALIDRLKYIAEEEGIEAEDEAIKLIAHHAEGGLRDAIGLLEQLTTENKLTMDHVRSVLGVSGVASIEKLYESLNAGAVTEALKEITEMHEQGVDLVFFNKRFLEFLRKQLLLSVDENMSAETERILTMIANFQTAYDQARYATIPQLPLEIAIVKSTMSVERGDEAGAGATAMGAEVGKNVGSSGTAVGSKVDPGASSVGAQVGPGAAVERSHQSIEAKVDSPKVDVSEQRVPETFLEKDKQAEEQNISAPSEAKAAEAEAEKKSHETEGSVNEQGMGSAMVESAVQNATPEAGDESTMKENQDGVFQNTTADLSLELVKKHWQDFEKKITAPVAKRSFHQASPFRVEGNKLILAFCNQFNLDKMMETQNRSEAEHAIEETLGVKVKLSGEIQKVAGAMNKEDKKLEEKVLDIFEGEVV